jgi:general secretion pathway protein D
VISGTTVQQPSFSNTSVSTTVSVPDGGTILLGGIKRMRESRIERGVPVLSKIPYLNRLFKNTAIGRETSTLMMTVTPRIIILEEEEEKYGVNPS